MNVTGIVGLFRWPEYTISIYCHTPSLIGLLLTETLYDGA